MPGRRRTVEGPLCLWRACAACAAHRRVLCVLAAGLIFFMPLLARVHPECCLHCRSLSQSSREHPTAGRLCLAHLSRPLGRDFLALSRGSLPLRVQGSGPGSALLALLVYSPPLLR